MSRTASSHRENEIELQELVIEQLKLLLAGVRTSLLSLRAGILLLTLPISIVGLLIITSKYHNILKMTPLSELIFSISGLTLLAGIYLIVRSLTQIHRYHVHIKRMEEQMRKSGPALLGAFQVSACP
jgi:hypothetical protein